MGQTLGVYGEHSPYYPFLSLNNRKDNSLEKMTEKEKRELRALFAAHALEGMLSQPIKAETDPRTVWDFSESALAYADAMLETIGK